MSSASTLGVGGPLFLMDNNTHIKELEQFHKQYPSMSLVDDLLIETLICIIMKPSQVWELGAGNGNWCSLMNHCSRPNNTEFTLVENFTLAKINDVKAAFWRKHHPYQFTTQEELISHMSNFDIKTNYFSEVKDLPTYIDKKIDIVRIDLDYPGPDQQKLANWILDNGSDNLVVIADDTLTNKCFHRFMIMQEQVAKGNLRLFWIGRDTSAWCRPKVDIEPFFHFASKFKNYYGSMKFNRPYTFFGYNQKYLIIRRHAPYSAGAEGKNT